MWLYVFTDANVICCNSNPMSLAQVIGAACCINIS